MRARGQYEIRKIEKCPGCGQFDRLTSSGKCEQCIRRSAAQANRAKHRRERA
jgi:hypothetical protein